MDFLGIGPLEVLLILVIALIIFGPKDIVKAGQSMGRFLRKLVTSPNWQAVQKTSRDLKNLPNKLIRDAGLDELENDIKEIGTMAKPPDLQKELQEELNKVEEGLSAWTTPIKLDAPQNKNESPGKPAADREDNTIAAKSSTEAEDKS